MTVVVGVLCKDGVVIGSDSSATFTAGQVRTIEQPTKKVSVVAEEIAFAGTGHVGSIQRFENTLQHLASSREFLKKDRFTIAKQITKLAIHDFAETACPPGRLGAVIAFRCPDGFQLCEFEPENLQPEFKTDQLWFVTMGSGQSITDPFLGMIRRVFFLGDLPRLSEAIFAVTWTLQQAIELNPGGIAGPPQLAVLELDKDNKTNRGVARLLTDEELQEHMDNVRGIEKHLALYRDQLSGTGSQLIPEP